MVPANRRYVIFEMSEVDLIDFSQVLQTSKDTLRLSNDGTKALIKYEPAPAQDEILYEEDDPEIREEVLYEEGDPEITEEVLYEEGDPELVDLNFNVGDVKQRAIRVGDVKQTAIRVGDIKILGRSGDEIPSSVDSLTTKSKGYTHFEILNELRGEEWTAPDIGVS